MHRVMPYFSTFIGCIKFKTLMIFSRATWRESILRTPSINLQIKQLYLTAPQGVFFKLWVVAKGYKPSRTSYLIWHLYKQRLDCQAKECVNHDTVNTASFLFNPLHMEPLYSVFHIISSHSNYQKSFLSLFTVSMNNISTTAGGCQRSYFIVDISS